MYIKLLTAGDQKILVIKLIKEYSGLSLKDSKDIADESNSVFEVKLPEAAFEYMSSRFIEAGAMIETTSFEEFEIFKNKNSQQAKPISEYSPPSEVKANVDKTPDLKRDDEIAIGIMMIPESMKIHVIKLLRTLTDWGLAQCKASVDSLPAIFKVKMDKEAYAKLKLEFQSLGCEIQIIEPEHPLYPEEYIEKIESEKEKVKEKVWVDNNETSYQISNSYFDNNKKKNESPKGFSYKTMKFNTLISAYTIIYILLLFIDGILASLFLLGSSILITENLKNSKEEFKRTLFSIASGGLFRIYLIGAIVHFTILSFYYQSFGLYYLFLGFFSIFGLISLIVSITIAYNLLKSYQSSPKSKMVQQKYVQEESYNNPITTKKSNEKNEIPLQNVNKAIYEKSLKRSDAKTKKDIFRKKE